MSAESKVLQTLKQLAQQYRPLIEAIPELEQIVDLQRQATLAASRLDELKRSQDKAIRNHEDVLRGSQDQIEKNSQRLKEIQIEVGEKRKVADGIIAAANTRAQHTLRDAEQSAIERAQRAEESAAALVSETKKLLSDTESEITAKFTELQNLNAEIAKAQNSLDEIHRLIDSVRPKK